MSKMQLLLRSILSLVILIAAMPAHAGTSEWAATDHAQIRMLSGVDSVGSNKVFEAALHMRMSKGWHSYWKVAGDAGVPPVFDWSGSENVESVEILWQAPKRFEEFGFQTFGYDGEVYFPLIITAKEPEKETKLSVEINTMVCKDICIPQNFKLGMVLPAGGGETSSEQRIIDFEKQRVPRRVDHQGLKIDTVVAGPRGLVVSAYSADGFDNADIFILDGDLAFTGIPEITPDAKDARRATIVVPVSEGVDNLSTTLANKSLEVTLVNGRNAIERLIKF